MAKFWIANSREGDDKFPGLIRSDLDVTNPSFAKATHYINLINKPIVATASMTTTTNLQDTSAPFTAAMIGHYVRFIDFTVVARIMQITAFVDASNVTVANAFFGTPSTGIVSAYFVGGPKRSLSTMAAGADPNSQIASSDSIILTGYFSGETYVNLPDLTQTLTIKGWQGVYLKGTVGSSIIGSDHGNSQTGNRTWKDLDFESIGAMAMRIRESGGIGNNTATLTDVRDYGDTGLLLAKYGSGFTSTINMTRCFAAKSLVEDESTGPGFGNIAFCQGNDIAANKYIRHKGIIINNIFRSSVARTQPFLFHNAPGFQDYNTIEVIDSPSQPVVNDGSTRLQSDFAAYVSTHANSRMRVSNNPANSVNPSGLGAIEFADTGKRAWIILPSSLEVGSADDGKSRGSGRSGSGLFATSSSPFRLDLTGNPKSWANISAVPADLIEDATTGGIKMNPSSTVPFSVKARFPYQGHASNPAPTPAVSGVPTHAYNAAAPGGFTLSWDAGADMFIGFTPRDVNLYQLLGIFSGILAAGSNFAIWDSTLATGQITISRVIGWTDSAGFSGSPSFDLSDVQLNSPLTSALVARYFVIEFIGRAE